MTEVVLDSHALVWLVHGDEQLSTVARRRIDAAPLVWVSAITAWEVGMLVAKGRLRWTRDVSEWKASDSTEATTSGLRLRWTRDVSEWKADVLALPGVRLAPLHADVAIASTRLPGEFHGDPAHPIIVATARHLGTALVSADQRIQAWAAQGHLTIVRAA